MQPPGLNILYSLLFGFLLVGCGVDGTYPIGVIDGETAGEILVESVYTGILMCAVRTGKATEDTDGNGVRALWMQRIFYKDYVQQQFNIDTGRGYRMTDVQNCAEYVQLGIILSDDCQLANWTCTLNPVNKFTGAN